MWSGGGVALHKSRSYVFPVRVHKSEKKLFDHPFTVIGLSGYCYSSTIVHLNSDAKFWAEIAVQGTELSNKLDSGY